MYKRMLKDELYIRKQKELYEKWKGVLNPSTITFATTAILIESQEKWHPNIKSSKRSLAQNWTYELEEEIKEYEN